MSGKKVSFNFGNSERIGKTDAEGCAYAEFRAPREHGTYVCLTYFLGDENFAQSGKIHAIVTVLPRPVGLEALPVSVRALDVCYLKAVLTDAIDGEPLARKNVQFSYKDKEKTVTTDINGKALVSFQAGRSSGTYFFTAVFDGDKTYGAVFSEKQSVTVLRRPVSVSVNNVVVRALDMFTADFMVIDSVRRSPVSDITALSNFENQVKHSVTNKQGISFLEYTSPAKAGEYALTVKSAGSETYEPSLLVKSPVKVIRRDAVIKAENVAVLALDDFAINAVLADAASNEPLSNMPLACSFPGKLRGKFITDKTGKASINYTAPAAAGEYQYELRYKGNMTYNPAVFPSGEVVVEKRPAAISVSSDEKVYALDPITVTVALSDIKKQQPVLSRHIIIEMGGKEETGITDASGSSRVEIRAPEIAGVYTVKASFLGDETYKSAEHETAGMSVLKRPTRILPQNVSARTLDTMRVKAALEDVFTGARIAGKPVRMNFRDSIDKIESAECGEASFVLRSPECAGEYEYTVLFDADGTYEASSAVGKAEISRRQIYVKGVNMDVVVFQNIELEARLEDELGPIVNKDVEFYFDGEKHTAVTNEHGKAHASVSAPDKKGKYNYSVCSPENKTYAASIDKKNKINISRRTPCLSGKDIEVRAQEEFTARVKISDKHTNEPLKGKAIVFKFLGEKTKIAADEHGTAEAVFKSPGKEGEYKAAVWFNGDNFYEETSAIFLKVTVLPKTR